MKIFFLNLTIIFATFIGVFCKNDFCTYQTNKDDCETLENCEWVNNVCIGEWSGVSDCSSPNIKCYYIDYTNGNDHFDGSKENPLQNIPDDSFFAQNGITDAYKLNTDFLIIFTQSYDFGSALIEASYSKFKNITFFSPKQKIQTAVPKVRLLSFKDCSEVVFENIAFTNRIQMGFDSIPNIKFASVYFIECSEEISNSIQLFSSKAYFSNAVWLCNQHRLLLTASTASFEDSVFSNIYETKEQSYLIYGEQKSTVLLSRVELLNCNKSMFCLSQDSTFTANTVIARHVFSKFFYGLNVKRFQLINSIFYESGTRHEDKSIFISLIGKGPTFNAILTHLFRNNTFVNTGCEAPLLLATGETKITVDNSLIQCNNLSPSLFNNFALFSIEDGCFAVFQNNFRIVNPKSIAIWVKRGLLNIQNSIFQSDSREETFVYDNSFLMNCFVETCKEANPIFMDQIQITWVIFEDSSMVQSPSNIVRIQNSVFGKTSKTPFAGGAIKIIGKLSTYVYIDNCTFEDNQALLGASIYVDNPLCYVSVQNSVFRNTRAAYGGSVYKVNSYDETIDNSPYTLLVKSCNFSNSLAYEKGGVLMLSSIHINVENSIFLNCSAKQGGILMSTASQYKKTRDPDIRSITEELSFINNSLKNISALCTFARIDFPLHETIIVNLTQKNYFTETDELICSGSISRVEVNAYTYMNKIDHEYDVNTNVYQKYKTESFMNSDKFRLIQTIKNISEENQQSVILVHNTSTLFDIFLVISVYNETGNLMHWLLNETYFKTSPLIINNQITSMNLTLSRGYMLYPFDKRIIIEKDGISEYISINEIDRRDNVTLFLTNSSLTERLFIGKIRVKMTIDCREFEFLNEETKLCQSCSRGLTYFMSMINGVCIPCDALKMKCFSIGEVYPQKGYWRIDEFSENFIECPGGIDACLGGVSNYSGDKNNTLLALSKSGYCNEPYTGNLCSDCVDEYVAIFSEDSRGKVKLHCTTCEFSLWGAFKMISTLLIGLVFILFALWEQYQQNKRSRKIPDSNNIEEITQKKTDSKNKDSNVSESKTEMSKLDEKTTIKNKNDKHTTLIKRSVVLRILGHYSQCLIIVFSFFPAWPLLTSTIIELLLTPFLSSFQKNTSTAESPIQHLSDLRQSSLECLLWKFFKPESIFISKTVFKIIQPIFLFFIIVFLYLLAVKIKNTRTGNKTAPVQTRKFLWEIFVLVMFVFQVDVIQILLEWFVCKDIGSMINPYHILQRDANIICWEGIHIKILIFLIFPLLIIWYGILVAIILISNKFRNFKIPFLIQGLTKKTYLWEAFATSRKIFFLLMKSFAMIVGIKNAIFLCSLVNVIYIVCAVKKNPYKKKFINKLEVWSSIGIFACFLTLSFIIEANSNDMTLYETFQMEKIIVNSRLWITLMIISLIVNFVVICLFGVFLVKSYLSDLSFVKKIIGFFNKKSDKNLSANTHILPGFTIDSPTGLSKKTSNNILDDSSINQSQIHSPTIPKSKFNAYQRTRILLPPIKLESQDSSQSPLYPYSS